MHIDQAKLLTVDDFRRHASALRPETRMFIDGELYDTQSGKRFETVNPATGLPGHADGMAALPRVKPEDKPWEILCRR